MRKVIIFSLIFCFVITISYAEKVRVVYKPDKSVTIIYPVKNSKGVNETEVQWLNRVFTKAMQGELKGLPYDDIDSSQLPDRKYRKAWEGQKGIGVSINMLKFTEIENKRNYEILVSSVTKQLAIERLKLLGVEEPK